MKRAPRLSVLAFMFLAAVAARLGVAAQAPSAIRPVHYLELDGSVNPGSADFLVRAISEAQGVAQAVVIRLDTPGGMVESTREIVKSQLASSIPIVVWVGPAGARAGSAGVFLTVAAHVAAMAPATNIGAAHPVSGSGEKVDEVMNEKITNDLVAWAQGIAKERGRNAEWVAEAVRKSSSIPAEEALEKKVVDLIAPDFEALMKALDGRKVKTPAGEYTLTTLNAPVHKVGMSPQEKFLDTLGDPSIAFLFMGIGALGILAEMYHPGTIFPGVLGAIFLAIGLLATRTLPVRGGAILLTLLGTALIAAEFFVTSYGLLAIGGAICLAIGAFLLIDPSAPGHFVDPDFGIAWSQVLPILLVIAGTFAVIIWKVTLARLGRQTTGAAGMVDEEARVVEEVGPSAGKVFLHGELWEARSAEPIAKDRMVKVVKVEGLKVTVVPVQLS